MHVTVIGTGFVGVVSAAVFASFGNEVYGLDIDDRKVKSLEQGHVPFYEPGLEELLKQGVEKGTLKFTTSYETAIQHADVILIAVGTPSAPDGNADLTYVRMAVESLAPHLKPHAVVCVKSTVPPGTLEMLDPILKKHAKVPYVLAALPEFLREGTAVQDTLHPDRVVLGCDDAQARETLHQLHAPFEAPIIDVKPESAQMGKYAGNAYLATRITFINQIADLCERNGADVQEVIEVMGHDKRIGKHYWYPGLGYGGSCFPKDVRELAAYSRSVGLGQNLFNKVTELNENRIFEKLSEFSHFFGGWGDKTVAVLGLSFKPQTDDTRDAPSMKLVPHLLHEGARVRAFDPMAVESAQRVWGEKKGLSYHEDLAEAIKGADIVLAVIEWPEIVGFDFASTHPVKGAIFIDCRNQFEGAALRKAGWKYLSIGRKTV